MQSYQRFEPCIAELYKKTQLTIIRYLQSRINFN